MEDEHDDWLLFGDQTYIEHCFEMWAWCSSIEWKVFPDVGGLRDQDHLLMTNIFTIEWMSQVIEAHIEANKPSGATNL